MAAPELQLSRLRGPSSSMVSEYNPNYEFGSGAPCSVQGLKEIPRENLRLVRLVDDSDTHTQNVI
jgi:anaplastic lymphoma kinase